MPPPGRGGESPKNTLALLGSLCLFLSAIEYLIPKPLPFMRIGLANLPLLAALNIFGAKDFFLLALLKVLGQGIIGGTLFSYVFLFSLAGTFSSAALMYVLHRLSGKYIGFTGLGCAGAMTSNAVQMVLARCFIFGPALRYLIPPFLASGFITGIALGLFCEYFCRHSRWYISRTMYAHTIVNHKENKNINVINKTPCPPVPHSPFRADELFFAGLVMALIFVFTRSISGHTAQFFFFCLLARLSGKKIPILATAVFMAGIVFFNLLVPYGKVLAVFGQFRITQGSLFAGLDKALVLGGLLMLSRACVKSDLKLPGIGLLLGECFRILELMREKKGIIRPGRVIAGIDRLMLEMEAADASVPEYPPRGSKRSAKSIILLLGLIMITAVLQCLHWLPGSWG